jgi:hypothetical protein
MSSYGNQAIPSESFAKETLEKLKSEGNQARIVCGYEKNIQRIKMFSIIFKLKKNAKSKKIQNP